MTQVEGYGEDEFCDSARAKIREATGCRGADVFFLVGGTQTNSTVIDAMLRRYEGVVAVDTGHIAVHESGAVEFSGHKVITLPGHLGKMDAGELREYLAHFHGDPTWPHMVYPGMVYISFPTEYGTIYSLDELKAIKAVCEEYKIPLFIDGARLGYGLASPAATVDLKTLASLCDVFYIGGTKVGALCGEAVVFPRGNAPRQFFTIVKQHGALLAKGRVLGIQFDALFSDGLYQRIGRPAIEAANRVREALVRAGHRLAFDCPTNQVFVVVDNAELKRLARLVEYSFWEAADDAHTVIRLASSWATTSEQVDQLLHAMLNTARRSDQT
jgi:threonine aldolase